MAFPQLFGGYSVVLLAPPPSASIASGTTSNPRTRPTHSAVCARRRAARSARWRPPFPVRSPRFTAMGRVDDMAEPSDHRLYRHQRRQVQLVGAASHEDGEDIHLNADHFFGLTSASRHQRLYQSRWSPPCHSKELLMSRVVGGPS